MEISLTLTTRLKTIRTPIPSTQYRPTSVPLLISKSADSRRRRSLSPGRRSKPRRSRKQLLFEKPPFINFASAFINPYRSLSPVPRRSKKRSSKRRRKRQQRVTIDDKENKIDENPVVNCDPIDLCPSDQHAFTIALCREREMAIGNIFIREKVHAWKVSTIDQLIELILDLANGKTLVDRVWMIFYWISQNIRFDIDAYYSGKMRHQKSEDVFRSCKGLSDGFATLFKTLCDGAELTCVKLDGYAKGYSFELNQTTFSHVNHAWNAVQLDGSHWYLIDPTWGSGHLDAKHVYIQELKPDYFLIRPEQMIYTHLPEDSQWQLLAKSISMRDFLRLPYLHSIFFNLGLSIVSPRFTNVAIFDAEQALAEVLIEAPSDVQLTCLIKNDTKNNTLTQYDASRQVWQCLFAPESSNFHTLIIFASRLSKMNVLSNAVEFGLQVPGRDLSRSKTLPITFGAFIEHKCEIFSPLDGTLKRGTNLTIHCRIPGASCARILLDGIWLNEKKLKNNLFKQEIKVPRKEVMVYAQFADKGIIKNYDGLICYAVE